MKSFDGQPWLARLLVAASLALLCWVLAYWFWHWSAPSPAPRALSIPEAPAAVVAESGIFGRGETPASAVAGATEPSAGTQPRLIGVLAEAEGRGWALLKLSQGGVKLLREGQEVEPGVRLEKVLPATVEISGPGGRKTLGLRAPESPRIALAQKSAAAGACPLSGDEKKRAYFVRPELLPGLAQSLDTARRLFRQEGGAWVVNQSDPALAALGLAAGDRIEKSNGVALHTEDLLRSAIVEPVMQSRTLRLTGTREGKPREWIYVNAALCG